ncbi:unnamed protein product [Microthlaspi erraticum]|uniref:NB-ARC domain-containing protein n=1 Tax=Microthlaspi erraticum TaxID=1685480 RepID=A0A6D2J9A2_9BRAS|nr:unnamed protein product [Microthlaspi erraticum]
MGLHPSYVVGVYELGVKILESLENDDVSRGMLVGEAGIGKTWLARKVFELAVEEGSCYMAIWLNLGKVLDEMSLYQDIASQLFLVPEKEESEEDNGGDEDNSEDEKEQTIQDLIRLKDEIHKELDRKKLSCEGTKYLLLVLDDEGSVTNEENVMKDLHLGEFLAPYGPIKIILTSRKGKGKGKGDAIGTDGEIGSHAADIIDLSVFTRSTY